MKFTTKDHEVWEILFKRQIPNIEKHACKEFKEGLRLLSLKDSVLPNISDLNSKIYKKTLWKIVQTDIRYLNQEEWSDHMSKKLFPITNFIRESKELDFTPEPDIFHDAFGHLPFLMIPEVVEIIEIFSDLYQKGDKDLNEISKLWWFSVEFGLIKEGEKIKAFGAGLMSSFGELTHVMEVNVEKIPFTVENVLKGTPAAYTIHNSFFVIESIEQLKRELRAYAGS